jgi:hypothetical protein
LPERFFAKAPGVDIGCIEEINAAIDGSLDQRVGFFLTDRADGFEQTFTVPESHRAKTKARDQQASVT